MVLFLEHFNELLEVGENWSNSFQVVFLKCSELLDGTEQLNELAHSSAEEIESSEDLVW